MTQKRKTLNNTQGYFLLNSWVCCCTLIKKRYNKNYSHSPVFNQTGKQQRAGVHPAFTLSLMHLNCIVAENTTNPNLTAAAVVQFKAVPWQFTTLIPDLDFGRETL